jgi:hypothetical protein
MHNGQAKLDQSFLIDIAEYNLIQFDLNMTEYFYFLNQGQLNIKLFHFE